MKKSILLATAVALIMGASVFAGSTGTQQGTTAVKAPAVAVNTTAKATTPATGKVMGKKKLKKKKGEVK